MFFFSVRDVNKHRWYTVSEEMARHVECYRYLMLRWPEQQSAKVIILHMVPKTIPIFSNQLSRTLIMIIKNKNTIIIIIMMGAFISTIPDFTYNNNHYYNDGRIYLNLSKSIQRAAGLKALKPALSKAATWRANYYPTIDIFCTEVHLSFYQ